MTGFHRKEGALFAEDVPLAEIARAVSTPCYVYSLAALQNRFRAWRQAFDPLGAELCYAVKANSNQSVLTALAREGAGADIVSGGELTRALEAGIPAQKILFSGVGKTAEELSDALSAGIGQINVESLAELEVLSKVATGLGVEAPVALRINPDVDAVTHEKITTGRKGDKFGIDLDDAMTGFAHAASLPGLKVQGIAVHIGSQLMDLSPYDHAFRRVELLVHALRDAGHSIDHVDLGGGLGIAYDGGTAPAVEEYAAIVRRIFGTLGCQITLEPGRAIVGPAGVLLTRLLYLKQTGERHYAIVDAAMNDLIRPSLYNAFHRFEPVEPPRAGDATLVDLVGPVCESGDVLARAMSMPPLEADDLLAIRDAGAYGFVMASRYNTRPIAAEVMVNGDDFAIIRARENVADIIAAEPVPDWLAGA